MALQTQGPPSIFGPVDHRVHFQRILEAQLNFYTSCRSENLYSRYFQPNLSDYAAELC